jgi:hypothetical protein
VPCVIDKYDLESWDAYSQAIVACKSLQLSCREEMCFEYQFDELATGLRQHS